MKRTRQPIGLFLYKLLTLKKTKNNLKNYKNYTTMVDSFLSRMQAE
ncbi:MAG: hypothetical protein JXQ93_07970 [Flavobacteriaceae bacterium]